VPDDGPSGQGAVDLARIALRSAMSRAARFVTALVTTFVTCPCPRGACDKPRLSRPTLRLAASENVSLPISERRNRQSERRKGSHREGHGCRWLPQRRPHRGPPVLRVSACLIPLGFRRSSTAHPRAQSMMPTRHAFQAAARMAYSGHGGYLVWTERRSQAGDAGADERGPFSLPEAWRRPSSLGSASGPGRWRIGAPLSRQPPLS
jgi:hypothetical protein